jgi:hypothetical protein
MVCGVKYSSAQFQQPGAPLPNGLAWGEPRGTKFTNK